jgi:hypothetical protein
METHGREVASLCGRGNASFAAEQIARTIPGALKIKSGLLRRPFDADDMARN